MGYDSMAQKQTSRSVARVYLKEPEVAVLMLQFGDFLLRPFSLFNSTIGTPSGYDSPFLKNDLF